MRVQKYVPIGLAACLLASCSNGGESGNSSGSGAPTTVTVTATQQTTTDIPQDPGTSSSSSSDTSTTDDGDLGTSSSTSDDEPDKIIRAQRDLTLEDAFRNDDWTFGTYTPVTGTGPIQAFAAKIACYAPASLEFRIQLESGRLVATAAQDLQSESSDAEIEFTLTADGRALKTNSIKFKETTEIATDLTGVSALVISAKNKPDRDGHCGTATALLTSLRIVPSSED